MTNLNPIEGFNIYCGPAVLATITGKTTDQCADVISMLTGASRVKAVQIFQLKRAFELLGFDSVEENLEGHTLYSALNYLHSRPGSYIVGVPRHVVAIEVSEDKKIYFIDNHTKVPMMAASSARLTQRVDSVFKVVKKREPILIETKLSVELDPVLKQVKLVRILKMDTGETKMIRLGGFVYEDIYELREINNILSDRIEDMGDL